MTAPVMAADRVEHRKAHAHAISSGVGWRRTGMAGRNSFVRSVVTSGWVSMSRTVFMKPGEMSLTVMPYWPSPEAKDFVRVRSPPLPTECGMRVQPPSQPSSPLIHQSRDSCGRSSRSAQLVEVFHEVGPFEEFHHLAWCAAH